MSHFFEGLRKSLLVAFGIRELSIKTDSRSVGLFVKTARVLVRDDRESPSRPIVRLRTSVVTETIFWAKAIGVTGAVLIKSEQGGSKDARGDAYTSLRPLAHQTPGFLD